MESLSKDSKFRECIICTECKYPRSRGICLVIVTCAPKCVNIIEELVDYDRYVLKREEITEDLLEYYLKEC